MSFSAEKYARQIVASSKKSTTHSQTTVATYRKFLSDLKRQRTEEFPYFYSEKQANIYIFLSERYAQVVLLDWQKFFVSQVFGWVLMSSTPNRIVRRYKEVYLEMAKKNGKTTLIALIAIVHAIAALTGNALSERTGHVYIVSNALRQAKICLDTAKQIIAHNPLLSSCFTTRLTSLLMHTNPVNNNSLTNISALTSSPKTSEGVLPSLVIVDEFHHASNTEMLDMLRNSMATRLNPLVIIITTAGVDRTLPAFEYREVCKHEIVEGESANGGKITETRFTLMYCMDENVPIEDISYWTQANPSIMNRKEALFTVDELSDVRSRILSVDTDTLINFYATRLGSWQDRKSVEFITPESWEATVHPEGIDGVRETLKRRVADARMYTVIGVDASTKNDFTSICLLGLDADTKEFFSTYYTFCTEKTIETSLSNRTYKNLQDFVDRGELIVLGQDVINLEEVLKYIRTIVSVYQIDAICYDYNHFALAGHSLKKEYEGRLLINHMPPVHTVSLKSFVYVCSQGALRHDGQTVIDWQRSNVTIVMDKKQNLSVDRFSHFKKIDSMMATIIAFNAIFMLNAELLPDFRTENPSNV